MHLIKPLSKEKIESLMQIAKRIRQHIIKMITTAGSGHPGGSLSATEIITALYFHVLRYEPKNPNLPERDRFILSKGHICAALYATFVEMGIYKAEELSTFRKLGCSFQGHPCMKKTRGIEMSSGSLGQGLSVGVGIALAARLDKKDYRTYVLIGDGESQEGQIWESAMSAAHYKLDNLCAILDYNNLQIDGKVEDIMAIEPIKDKWEAFGWHTIQINGHSFEEIVEAFGEAISVKYKPTIIIAKTIKGKGVSFMENRCEWHGKAPTKKECDEAIKELEIN